MPYPSELRYAETHEWLKIVKVKPAPSPLKGKPAKAEKKPKEVKKRKKADKEEKKIGVIGITDFAVEKLNEITYIQFPEVGSTVKQGEPFGEIESIKTTAELLSPVTGKVTAVNEEIKDHLEIISKDPYDDGWLIKVEMKDETEADSLMTATEYRDFIKTSEEEEGGEDLSDDFMM